MPDTRISHLARSIGVFAGVMAFTWQIGYALATDAIGPRLMRPLPYQVVQREGFHPREAHSHGPLVTSLGFAEVPLELSLAGLAGAELDGANFEYQVVSLVGDGVEPAKPALVDWTRIAGKRDQDLWRASARVPAGGWYRLSLRARHGEQTLFTASAEPFGVGEVFVVAGQSYAVGANDEVIKVEDAQGRVAAYDVQQQTWRVAHDPQPNAGDGGTIWPTTGDLLLPAVRVPIGFVNVAVGGTATRQWLPGEKLYQQLSAAGKSIGRFRAVLWQQGESDVIEHRSTEYYADNMTRIRQSLARDWGFEPPWLLAKSTLHPTVYNDPAGEGRIRAAIDKLWATPGFRPGPDTDILDGESRGGLGTRRHFSGIGQRRAALLWFAAIWQELNRD